MAHKEQITKTNAARLLDELGISYSIHESEADLSDLSAVSMAKKIGADPLRVFKTLVARGDKTGVIMACLPGSGELDLKALAKASDNKHVEMVHLKRSSPSPATCAEAARRWPRKRNIPSSSTRTPYSSILFTSAPDTGEFSWNSRRTTCSGPVTGPTRPSAAFPVTTTLSGPLSRMPLQRESIFSLTLCAVRRTEAS